MKTATSQYDTFIAQVLWEGTDNWTGYNTYAWVEAGYTDGWWDGTGDWNGSRVWYWAHWRIDGYYYDNEFENVPCEAGTWHWLKIKYEGDWEWWFSLDGDRRAIAEGHAPNSRFIATGIESTSTANTMGTQASPAKSWLIAYWRGQEQQWYDGLVAFDDASNHGVRHETGGNQMEWSGGDPYSRVNDWND